MGRLRRPDGALKKKADERGEKAAAAARAAAFELVTWTLWAMSGDKFDIKEGERPIGEPGGKVRGMNAAVAKAKMILASDPGIRHVRLEPEIVTRQIKPMIVKRISSGVDVNGPLDPQAGEGDDDWPK